MMSFITRHIFLIAIVGVVVVGGLWYLLKGDSGTDELLTTTSASASESEAEKGIVDTLLTLRAVSLSGTIFSDPAFDILHDFGTQIVPEASGRPNPFGPREGRKAPPGAASGSTSLIGSQP